MNIQEELEKRIDNDKDIGNYLKLLLKSTYKYTNPEILEFGTWEGSSTLAFLYGIEQIGGHLTSVDIKKYNIVDKLKDNKNVTFVLKDSRQFESDKKYNIILVDTLHNYNQVKEECNIIKELIKKGTIIFFHDTVFKPEIIPAIEEFVKDIKCEIIKHNEGYGMWEVKII